MSPEFLLATFIVCLTRGIGAVYTLSMTLGGGLRAGQRRSFAASFAALGLRLALERA